MTAAALQHDAFAPRPPPGMRSGFGLAVAAHVLLVLALAWSVNWKASEPEGVIAELWSTLPQTAAPRVVAPEPRPPVVEPRPVPPRAEPAPPPPREDAQIAIERAARDKERRVEAERAELARQAEKKRRDELRRAQEKQREEQQQTQRLAEEQAEKKKLADQVRKDEARQAAIREANLKKMMSQAGSSEDTSAAGTAARSSGPSAGYAGRIKARIKPNIVLTGSVSGNPLATVEVRLAPDGTIIGRKLVRSSGSVVWDETVLRAIDKTEVLPKDIDGRVPSSLEIEFKPRE